MLTKDPFGNILLIEDDQIQQMAFKRLAKSYDKTFHYKIAGSINEAKSLIKKDQYDIVITDYTLGDGTGMEVFDMVKDTPVIMVTANGNEKIAIQAFKKGAYEYLIKDEENSHLKALPGIIEQALKYKMLQSQLKKAETELKKLSIIAEKTQNLILVLSPKGLIEWVNDSFIKNTGFNAEQVIGTHGELFCPNNQSGFIGKDIIKLLNNTKKPVTYETSFKTNNKDNLWVLASITPNINNNKVENIIAVITDISKQKKSEKKLRNITIRLSTLIDNLESGIIFENKDREVMHVNSSLYHIFNFPEDHRNLSGYEFYEKLKEIAAGIKATNNKQSDVLKQFIHYSLKSFIDQTPLLNEEVFFIDGRIFHCTFLPIEQNGSFYGYMWKWVDITKRKLAEIELKEAASYATDNPNPVLRIDSNGKLIYANKSSENLLEFWNVSVGENLPPKILKLVQSSSKKITRETEIKCGESYYSLIIVPLADNKHFNLYGRDITISKLAKEKLEKLSWVASVTDSSVIITDNKGEIEWVNDGFVHFTGYTLEEIKGTHGDIIRRGTENSPYYSKFFKKVLDTGKSLTVEGINYKKDGGKYWCQTRLTPMFDINGIIYKIIGIETDINSLKQIQEQLQEQKERAEQSERYKEQFLANISHEIRTPMNAILAMSDLLLDTEVSEQQKKYLNIVQGSSDNLLVIINDVLDLSKIEAGKISFLKREFNCIDLIKQVEESIRLMANKEKVKIIADIDAALPKLLIGDPVRLNQILLNLANNAVKFTEKGSVIIKAKVLKDTSVTSSIIFSVIDTGSGIPQKMIDKIFEPFIQLLPKKNDTYKRIGTGLGLSIVKQLVELQQGTLRVYSKVGKGSEFSFILNFKKATKQVKTVKPIQIETRGRVSAKIVNVLVAEDNETNQFVMEEIFKKWPNFRLKIVDNGQEAIDELKKAKYDIIIMDIEMPKMNGYEATDYIRNQMSEPVSRIPIIALTAHATTKELSECKRSGMNDYLTKPFHPKQVLQKLNEFI